MKKQKIDYVCQKCGTISKHRPLSAPRAFCKKCQKLTPHRLLSGLKLSRTPFVPEIQESPSSVQIKHEPETLTEPETSEKPEDWATEQKEPKGEPLAGMFSAEDWADIYGLPAETLSLILKRPEIDISDESCKIQGERLARYCERHNIVLPDFIDIVPIVVGISRDYGKMIYDLFQESKKKEKEQKKPDKEPDQVKIPESSVARVSDNTQPIDIDAVLNRGRDKA